MYKGEFYNALIEAMHSVKDGLAEPDQAVDEVFKIFSGDRVYIPTWSTERRTKLMLTVCQMKAKGMQSSTIAKRLNISQRHVNRLIANMN